MRYLHATAGIVITASHNPPQYNGYKVYWSDGGQIVPPYDKKIIDRVNAVSDYGAVRTMSEAEARRQGMIEVIGKEVDDAYMDALKRVVLRPEVIRKMAKDIKIVYTPLNGTGYMPVTRVLKELGFENVRVVPQQAQPDGNFPTLRYPNPEDPAAFALALELAEQNILVNTEMFHDYLVLPAQSLLKPAMFRLMSLQGRLLPGQFITVKLYIHLQILILRNDRLTGFIPFIDIPVVCPA